MSAPARAISVLVEQNPEMRSESGLSETVTHDDIAQLSYAIWLHSGRPSGSAETDWLDAEQTLREPAGVGSRT